MKYIAELSLDYYCWLFSHSTTGHRCAGERQMFCAAALLIVQGKCREWNWDIVAAILLHYYTVLRILLIQVFISTFRVRGGP